MNGFKQLLSSVLLAFFTVNATAAVISVGQSPVGGGEGPLSSSSSAAYNAEDFKFNADVELSSISWWGSYDGGKSTLESFGIQIFSSLAPETELAAYSFSGQGVATSLVDYYQSTIYKYTLAISSPLSLSANTEYYLSIFNDDVSADDWYWTDSTDGDYKNWYLDNGWQEDNQINLSFQLTANTTTAPIPEPAPMALMLLPFLWVARQAMKKSRQ